MRKSIKVLLSLLVFLGISLTLSAQSNEEELDQVKLSKQFIGTWECKIGEDSILLWTCTPSYGEGILNKLEWKSNGKVYQEAIAVIGFSDDLKTIINTIVWWDGRMTHDIGRFVTEKKWVMERFRADSPDHAVALLEGDFSTPNSCIFSIYGRGQNITWEPLWEVKFPYTKID